MQRSHNYLTTKRIIILAVVVLVVVIALTLPNLFTLKGTTLKQVAAADDVNFIDRSNSLDIVPRGHLRATTAVIFYPGALVDARSYAPELASLAHATGLQVFIVKPYLRLAVLDSNAASAIIAAHRTVKNWFIGGHSMGGGAACSFSAKHQAEVQGLFLLAAYCSPSARSFQGATLAIVGGHDSLEAPSKVRLRLPAKAKVIEITGANHASFGDYGGQPFDGQSSISQPAMPQVLTQDLKRFIVP